MEGAKKMSAGNQRLLQETRAHLKSVLFLNDLELEEMPENSNCQFHAIADQIRKITGVSGVCEKAIRAAVVEEIKAHPGSYRTSIGDFNSPQSGNSHTSTMQKYTDAMVCLGEWGNKCTLQATANMLQVPVKVYSTSCGLLILHPQERSGHVPEDLCICLAYIGENHYDSTRPVHSNTQLSIESIGALKLAIHKKGLADSAGKRSDLPPSVQLQKKRDSCSGPLGCLDEQWKENILKGYLYNDVPAYDVSRNFDCNSKVVFDICISSYDKHKCSKHGVVYTRRRGGDGMWRLWPVIEDPHGKRPTYAKDARPPWQTHSSRARYASENDERRVLRETQENSTLLPVSMHIRCTGNVAMLCCIKLQETGMRSFQAENMILFDNPKIVNTALIRARRIVAATRKAVNRDVVECVTEEHKTYSEQAQLLKASIEAKDIRGDDTDEVLMEYDDYMHCVETEWGLHDDEKEIMDEADKSRKDGGDSSSNEGTDFLWCKTWRRALHEGARLLLISCLEDKSIPFERRLVQLMDDNADVRDRVLHFVKDENIKRDISTRHLKGEALDLLACFLALARGQCQVRDYRETTMVLHKCTKVERVFMQGAPLGSPFRLNDGDLVKYVSPCTPEMASFAARMEIYCKRYPFLDVLVLLRDPDNEKHPWHFQVIRCNARRNRRINVHLDRYVKHMWPVVEDAKRVGCLMSLEWMSNCYEVKQIDQKTGEFRSLDDNRYVRCMMFSDMVIEQENLMAAVAKAREGFETTLESLLKSSGDSPIGPDCRLQEAALRKLAKVRQKGKRYYTVISQIRSVKLLLMSEDGLRSQEEQGHEMPLLAMCLTNFLVNQLAVTFALLERKRIRKLFEKKRRFYYVICPGHKRVACPLLCSITIEELLAVMLQHYSSGSLGFCRFFTNLHESARFWDIIITFIRVTRGVSASLMEPVFGTFSLDGVQKQFSQIDSTWSLGLNIPARWCTLYTEIFSNAETTKKSNCTIPLIKPQKDFQSAEMEGPSFKKEEFEDASYSASTMLLDVKGKCTFRTSMSKYRFHGLHALSESLQFVSINKAVDHGLDPNMVRIIQAAWNKYNDLSMMIQEGFEGRHIVVFEVNPEHGKGHCSCKFLLNIHNPWCSFNVIEQSKRETKVSGIFRAFVKENGNLHWFMSSNINAKSDDTEVFNPIVLGWHEASRTLCVQVGKSRGMPRYDQSFLGWACRNDVSISPECQLTFSEAVWKDPAMLARPALVLYTIDPFVLPLNLEKPPQASDHFRRLIECRPLESRNTKARDLETGIRINSPSKIFYTIEFPEFKMNICATGQEYAAAMLVVQLLEQNLVKKPVVSCASRMSCRRTMALFKLLIKRHLFSEKEIGCAHFFQSHKMPGSEETNMKSMHVLEHILGEFQSSERFVLFSKGLLLTGVNLCCCDATVLVSPSPGPPELLQQWGISLTKEDHIPGKRGFLVLVGDNPKETTEDVEHREKALGLGKVQPNFSDGDQIGRDKLMHMRDIVEAAMSNSNPEIGATLDMLVHWRRKQLPCRSDQESHSIPIILFSSQGFYEVTLTECVGKVFAKMFAVRGRDLMERTWLEKYLDHKDAMEKLGRWKRELNKNGNRPKVFKQDKNGIPEERTVVGRRNTLLGKKDFDEQCQEFHDFYFRELGYNFKEDWKQNKTNRNTPRSEKYEKHKQAMLRVKRWKTSKNENGNRPNVFNKRSAIPEERAIVGRRKTLLGKTDFDEQCQEFHDFYFRELGYNFKEDWKQNKGNQNKRKRQDDSNKSRQRGDLLDT